ncbi:hypothetical protein Cni_G23084 [Canna indica]|uniref:ARGOS-like protein n=1 Tax=Canna indica TaxID=4628 RepID=A0AAQ3KT03_9LILI|nr:hypothetical protein Cni_G23084 [Canna indica]
MSGTGTDNRTHCPPVEPEQHRAGFSPSNYFSMQSLLVLIFFTLSLLILPLVLPPLPPPPSVFLFLPVGILVVLMILAFMPADIRNIASSYL